MRERPIKEKQKGQKITTVEQPGKAPVIDLWNAQAQHQRERQTGIEGW